MKEIIENWPEKKTEIVKATISTVAREGLDKATTSLIARRAGVGEGTIYRYFRTKDEIIVDAAVFASCIMFELPRKNYNSSLSVHEQYVGFCRDYLISGMNAEKYHAFMQQFIDSPAGQLYRKKTIKEAEKDPEIKPLIYPMNAIFHDGLRLGVLKELPLVILVAMTLGPLVFTLKNAAEETVVLTDALIDTICESCWASVRR